MPLLAIKKSAGSQGRARGPCTYPLLKIRPEIKVDQEGLALTLC